MEQKVTAVNFGEKYYCARFTFQEDVTTKMCAIPARTRPSRFSLSWDRNGSISSAHVASPGLQSLTVIVSYNEPTQYKFVIRYILQQRQSSVDTTEK
jgi:hypothetical protein